MRTLTRIGLAAAIAVALFAAAAVSLTRGSAEPAGAQQPPAPDAGALLVPAGDGSLDSAIASLQERLRLVPTDWQSFAALGLAYVQEARISQNPDYYPKADDVLHHSLDLHATDNSAAHLGLAALAAARHDFSGALDEGREARRIDPYDGDVYGVIGDALVELGHYHAAFATFQKMVNIQPGLASYARVSYARELKGDVAGAVQAMRAARDIAGTAADSAWASNQLGELYFNSGRLSEAERAYRDGTKFDPNFVPPFAGLAKVAWARGDLEGAIAAMTDVVNRYPSPEYATLLGDLLHTAGDDDGAATQYDLVRAEAGLFAANGVNTDLEIALFDADHGDPAASLAAARDEWARRHSIHVADALAWALHANGRDREAVAYSDQALALDTQNALLFAHAGLIRQALGQRDEARSLLSQAESINPHFSVLLAPRVYAALAELGVSR